MTTPIWFTGAEHGTIDSNGGGLFDAVVGSPALATTGTHSGGYCLKYAVTGTAATCYVTKTIAGTNTVYTGVAYFKYHTKPSALTKILRFMVAAGSNPALYFDPADNKIMSYLVSNGNKANVALSVDTWYRIDFKIDVSANPNTIDFKVDGTAANQYTYGQAGTNLQGTYLGLSDAVTGEVYLDDIVFSATSGDYPIGNVKIEAISPTGDGIHNIGNSLKNQAGTVINGTTTEAYPLLDDIPMSGGSDYVQQTGTGSYYAEVTFADTSQTGIVGAMGIIGYHSSGTQTNKGSTILLDENSTERTVFGTSSTPVDMSESSRFFKSAYIPAPTGGWDQGAVNALKGRIGYSSDVSPIPYWDSFLIEVAYTYTDSILLTVANSTQTQPAGAPAFTQHNILSVANASQACITTSVINLIQHYHLTVSNVVQNQTVTTPTPTAHSPPAILVVQNVTQLQTVGNVGLVQHNILVLSNVIQGQSTNLSNLTQHNILVPNNVITNQTVTNSTLTQHNILVVNSGSQVQSATVATLVQHSILVINNVTQNQTVLGILLTQHNILVVNNSSQYQTTTTFILGVALLVSNSTQIQSAENKSLTQHYSLTVENAGQTQTAQTKALTQHYVITVANVTQIQVVATPSFIQHNVLSVSNTSQLQTVATPTPVYHVPSTVTLVVQNVEQIQSTPTILLVQHNLLVVNSIAQIQTAESKALTQHNILIVDNTNQSSTVESKSLVQHGILNVANVVQNQEAQSKSLIQHFILTIQNVEQLQTVQTASLTQHNVLNVNAVQQLNQTTTILVVYHAPNAGILTVQSVLQVQTATTPSVTQHNLLVVNNATQPQSPSTSALLQHNRLNINNVVQGQTSSTAILIQHYNLIVNSSVQTEVSNNILLTASEPATLLVIQNVTQLQNSDQKAVVQHNLLVVDSILQHQTAVEIFLTAHGENFVLVIQNSNQTQTATENIVTYKDYVPVRILTETLNIRNLFTEILNINLEIRDNLVIISNVVEEDKINKTLEDILSIPESIKENLWIT